MFSFFLLRIKYREAAKYLCDAGSYTARTGPGDMHLKLKMYLTGTFGATYRM
jgi:hypothetical protein